MKTSLGRVQEEAIELLKNICKDGKY